MGFRIMMYMIIYILTLIKTIVILLPLLVKPYKRTNTINSSIREKIMVKDIVNE